MPSNGAQTLLDVVPQLLEVAATEAGQPQAVPRASTLSVPPDSQSDQMQTALKECITALQSVWVQRHTIISTKKTQEEIRLQTSTSSLTAPPTMPSENKVSDVLDQAFASTHLQIFTAISNLQRRMFIIQSGISPSCDTAEAAVSE